VLFVHAAGFCKEVWQPVIEDTAASGVGLAAMSLDLRGHGGSGTYEYPLDWWRLGGDVLSVLAGRTDVIGVGHSAGGAALALAELLAPGTFRSLVLVEPIISPPPFKRFEAHPLALGTLKRTPVFASRDAAAVNFRGRGPFAGWDDRAFQGYLEGGLHPNPILAPDAVRLACHPEDEAEYYRSGGEHRAWNRLSELAVPVEIIAGENSDTHSARFVGNLAGRMQRATVTWVPEASHFVPMQRPQVVAAAVAAAVSGEWAR